MRYRYILPMFFMCSTLSLYAEQSGLGDILQQVGEKNTLVKPLSKKEKSKKASRFIFVDKYDANGIGSKDKMAAKEKSKSYKYENEPRYKFKFNSGTGYNNIAGGPGASTAGGGSAGAARGMSAGGGHGGGGQGRGGRR